VFPSTASKLVDFPLQVPAPQENPTIEETLQIFRSGSSCRSQDLKKSLLAYAEGFYVLYTMGAQ
jgi:hypothetical protein